MWELLQHLSPLDLYALAWFALCWIGYSVIADHTPLNRFTASAAMVRYRREWMCRMMERDMRIMDAQLHGNLLQGIGFMATTTILAIGGMLALLGSTERAMMILTDLPYVEPATRVEWEIKILLMLLIFIYAFFKFAWAYRLANWNSIIIGAAPVVEHATCDNNEYVERLVKINQLSSGNFNRGVRAYFFALAALSLFLDDLVFIVSTALVLLVLIHREFGTRAVVRL